jgi:hypothetical protein
MSRFTQSASGKAQRFPQGLKTLGADRLSEKVILHCEVADAVAKARAAESSGVKLLEPPGFSHGEVQRAERESIASHEPTEPESISLRLCVLSSLHPLTKLCLILGDLTPPMRRAIETEGLQRKFPL